MRVDTPLATSPDTKRSSRHHDSVTAVADDELHPDLEVGVMPSLRGHEGGEPGLLMQTEFEGALAAGAGLEGACWVHVGSSRYSNCSCGVGIARDDGRLVALGLASTGSLLAVVSIGDWQVGKLTTNVGGDNR